MQRIYSIENDERNQKMMLSEKPEMGGQNFVSNLPYRGVKRFLNLMRGGFKFFLALRERVSKFLSCHFEFDCPSLILVINDQPLIICSFALL